jgi:hypothetical protein
MQLPRINMNGSVWTGWLLFFLASAVVLSSLSAYNGYPIVFADTGSYLACSFSHVVPADRPVFYSLFLEAVQFNHHVRSLWLVVVAQVSMSLILLSIVFRHQDLAIAQRPVWRIGVVLFLTLGTSLPWELNWVMPDIFAAFLALSVYLVMHRWTDLRLWEKWYVGLSFVTSAVVHYTHLIVTVLLAAGFLAHGLIRRRGYPRPLLALTLASFAALFTVNLALAGSLFFSEGGHVFFVNRLAENGILHRLLTEHCPQNDYALCPYKDQIKTMGVDDYTWSEESPLHKIGGWVDSRDESRRVILDSVRYYPFEHARQAVYATGRQFVSFRTGYGMKSYADASFAVHQRIEKHYPREYDAFMNARQQDGTLERVVGSVGVFHLAVSWVSIVLVCVAYMWNWRSGPRPCRDNDLIAILLLFMVLNAFVCASLNTIVNRYQSRVVWLITLAAVIAASRWWVEMRGNRTGNPGESSASRPA